jgi:hypothetical protein
MQCWKDYSIADCITNIKESMDEIKPETVDACWLKLLPEYGNDFIGSPSIEKDVNKIVDVARQLGVEGFSDMVAKEIEELIDCHGEELTEEDLEELVKSAEEDEEEETLQLEQQGWDLNSFGELFRNIKVVRDFIAHHDPSMERSLKIVQEINQALVPCTHMFETLKARVHGITK